MRCARCGNENPEGNRFCGMCGGTLLTPEVPVTQTQRAAVGSTTSSSTVTSFPRSRAPEPPRPAPEPESAPSISGPSFLGLNDPAPRRPASVNADRDSSSSSRNLDYLLEDDEPRRGSAGKIFLILIALALAVGFGYLRWKNHGMDWLKGVSSKPAATAPATGPEPTPSPAPSSTTPEAQSPPATANTPAPIQQAPSENKAAPSVQPDASSTTPNSPPKSDAAEGSSPAPDTGNSTPAEKQAATPAAKQPADSSADENSDQTDTSSEDAEAKPSPAPKPVRAADSVAEARKYLYGRGATQDCDRGLRLLKPAANQGNPKAMVEMGALYSAGLCTPHDLPTAYRWFALALRKDPANQAIQTDLQKLWSEMTQPERQLAIKLTQ